jgi:hypothetical protein
MLMEQRYDYERLIDWNWMNHNYNFVFELFLSIEIVMFSNLIKPMNFDF